MGEHVEGVTTMGDFTDTEKFLCSPEVKLVTLTCDTDK